MCCFEKQGLLWRNLGEFFICQDFLSPHLVQLIFELGWSLRSTDGFTVVCQLTASSAFCLWTSIWCHDPWFCNSNIIMLEAVLVSSIILGSFLQNSYLSCCDRTCEVEREELDIHLTRDVANFLASAERGASAGHSIICVQWS